MTAARSLEELGVRAIGVRVDLATYDGVEELCSAVRDTGQVPGIVAINAGVGVGGTYAASKAFLLSFAEALRYELRDTGITVTALLPGPTDTEFFERAGLTDCKLGDVKKDDPAEVARQGIEALLAGKDHVIAGSVKNKAQVASGRLMSQSTKAAMQGRLTQPRGGLDSQ